jgi:NADH dehydrogenase/NADH:ubiquinone oxidoreductase subunit G
MNVTIDGKVFPCEPGEYLLDITKRNGISIPAFCHHGGIPGQGCCRVCIVEVEVKGWKSIVTACVYPIERECIVYTNSDRVKKQRGLILALLRSRAPESDMINQYCEQYGVPEYKRLLKKPNEKCILCALCTKACGLLGTGAIATVNRGVDKTVSTPYDEPPVDCVGCGSCAVVCPTETISLSEAEGTRTIWGKDFTLQNCERCGIPFGTLEEIEFAAKKADLEPSGLCFECKRKTITDTMAHTFGV